MSSSIAMSTAAASGPGATRPALSQLVAAHNSNSRNMRRCARDYSSKRDKAERISRRVDRYHRHPQANIRRKTEGRQDWPSTAHRDPSSTWGWGLWRSRSSFSDFSAGREKSFWDSEREQMQQRMAHLRKHLAEDPCGAIFGRRLNDSVWPGFLQSFMNTEPTNTGACHSSKAHLQDFNFAKSPQSSNTAAARDMLQYDPISGRMAPKPPSPSEDATTVQGHSTGIDCPPGSEVEAKFASKPSLVEDGQFQPGSVPIMQGSEGNVNSQSIDCPPGSELEALFTTDPASYKDAHVMARVPHGQETAVKPNVNVDCPPGHELEALLISESARTDQAHAETFKVQGSPNNLSADAGLSSGANVDCAPGSELEAMFISKPAAREDQTRPLHVFNAQPAGQQADITVDCPPGNELDAKFAAECAGLGPRIESVPQPGANIDCPPGSELEAKFSASAAHSVEKSEPAATVDCPPGSELEAKFIADPASTEDGQYQPAMAAEPVNSKKANVTVDCAPGSELEALFISDAASSATRDASEDMGALNARDIRARYASMADIDNAPQPQKTRPAQNLKFDGSEDRVGDFLLQNQKPASEKASEQWSSADYRILAYDSSVSKVTTSEASTFFGASETAQPHEILSRLHNPAKFVPFFAQMQQDGYEIATGGGDILIFRRSPAATQQATAAAAEQDTVSPMTHAEIAKYIRHDSYDLTDSFASKPSFTSKVSRQ